LISTGYKKSKNGIVYDENCRVKIKEMFEYTRDEAASYADVRRKYGVYHRKDRTNFRITQKEIERINNSILFPDIQDALPTDKIASDYGLTGAEMKSIRDHNGKPPYSLTKLADVKNLLKKKTFYSNSNPLIDENLFNAVQEKISKFTKNNMSPFMLAGLIKCGECGLALRYKEYRTKDEENKRYTAFRIVCSQNNVKNRTDRPSHIDRKCNFKEDIDAFDLENKLLSMVLESKKIPADEELILKDYFYKISNKFWDGIIKKENVELSRKCRNILSEYIGIIKIKNLNEIIHIDFKEDDLSVIKENLNWIIATSTNDSAKEDNRILAENVALSEHESIAASLRLA